MQESVHSVLVQCEERIATTAEKMASAKTHGDVGVGVVASDRDRRACAGRVDGACYVSGKCSERAGDAAEYISEPAAGGKRPESDPTP